MKCYVCKGKNLIKFLDLGHHAPSDAFLTEIDLNNKEDTYPLNVLLCKDCFLVQLGYAVSPEILFNRDFVYTTGSNNSLKSNFKKLVDLLVDRFKLTQKDLAIDVGSNDGTLLKNYIPYNVRILGIDPSKAAEDGRKEGVPAIVDYFNHKISQNIIKKYGKAAIITSTNTFAHIHDLDSTMAGVKMLLEPNGVFVTESHYLLDMIENMQYDWIYHEHLRHYSLKPLQTLFKRYDLEIFDVERIKEGHGGSIRVFASFKGVNPISKRVNDLIKTETQAGIYQIKTYVEFAKKIQKNKLALLKMVVDIKLSGKKIVGIGAPAKGNTLLNYCKLDSNLIDYLAEKSPFKIGKFTPGTHIPVIDESMMYKDNPDYGLLLSWNLADELIPKLRINGFKGKFIVPSPKPRIL